MALPRIVSRHKVCVGASELRALLRAGHDAVAEFEAGFAALLGVRHAFALSSARSATALALEALDLPAGSEIALPEYCFHTVPWTVRAMGFIPRFIAVDEGTHAMAPEALAEALSQDRNEPGIRAVIVVQPFGGSCDMSAMQAQCTDAGIPLIEDASQSIGSFYAHRRVGSLGSAGVFSFVEGKNLTCFGGGALVTDDDALAEQLRPRVDALSSPSGDAVRSRIKEGISAGLLSSTLAYKGGVFPLIWTVNQLAGRAAVARLVESDYGDQIAMPEPTRDALRLRRMAPAQAAVGSAQLPRLDTLNRLRIRNGETLMAELWGAEGLGLPEIVEHSVHTWNSFAITLPLEITAQDFAGALLRRGVDSRPDYMSWYRNPDAAPPKPRRARLYLPTHPGLGPADMRWAAQATHAALAELRR